MGTLQTIRDVLAIVRDLLIIAVMIVSLLMTLKAYDMMTVLEKGLGNMSEGGMPFGMMQFVPQQYNLSEDDMERMMASYLSQQE